jgi:hypothetical protein
LLLHGLDKEKNRGTFKPGMPRYIRTKVQVQTDTPMSCISLSRRTFLAPVVQLRSNACSDACTQRNASRPIPASPTSRGPDVSTAVGGETCNTAAGAQGAWAGNLDPAACGVPHSSQEASVARSVGAAHRRQQQRTAPTTRTPSCLPGGAARARAR